MSALALLPANLVHKVRRFAAGLPYEPRGVRVDVGAQRRHLIAEGLGAAGPGAEGLSMYHFLQSFRDGNRSVPFDRFGTGWSNSGPFPRSTSREAEELVTLLAIAGKVGPLVPTGHSMDDSWL